MAHWCRHSSWLKAVALLLIYVQCLSAVKLRHGARQPEELGSSLAQPAILLMSSPMERKVSYVEIIGGRAHGPVRPLIDTGLQEPTGIVYDPRQSVLYVADTGQRKIFRYSLGTRTSSMEEYRYDVIVNDVQVAIVEGISTQWLAVDRSGGLFFSDKERRSINRLSLSTIKMVVGGYATASQVLPDDTAADAEEGLSALPASQRAVSLFRRGAGGGFGLRSHVDVPAGVALDGPHVVWANAQGGTREGTVVSAPFYREHAAFQVPEPHALTQAHESAFAVAAVDVMLLFSGPSTAVYGLCRGGSGVQTLADTFVSPRGLVWDGESTAYVADSGANAVFALPTGRCHAGLPVQHVVNFHGAFGLAMITGKELGGDEFEYSQRGLSLGSRFMNGIRWMLR